MELATNILVLVGFLLIILLWFGIFLFILLKAKWPNWVKLGILIPAGILALPVFFIILYMFFFRPYQVNGEAMLPTYSSGAYLLSRVFPGTVNRGDIIVFSGPDELQKDYIKRVIGLPGETVKVANNNMHINGVVLEEYYTSSPWSHTSGGKFVQEGQEYVVPANSYFVLGDNRQFSSDSREWGFVPKEYIKGKIILCYSNCNSF